MKKSKTNKPKPQQQQKEAAMENQHDPRTVRHEDEEQYPVPQSVPMKEEESQPEPEPQPQTKPQAPYTFHHAFEVHHANNSVEVVQIATPMESRDEEAALDAAITTLSGQIGEGATYRYLPDALRIDENGDN